jgi:hypothetical protein
MKTYFSYVVRNQEVETKHESLIELKISKEILHTLNSNEERSYWHKTLVDINDNNIDDLISNLSQQIGNYQGKKVQYKYDVFLKKILETYHRYISESEENQVNKFHQPSYNSLLQLARFIPELPEDNLDVYLDEMTGCFGVIIKIQTKSKPVLNLLMKENKEVIFSFIKRKNKIIKISGRAYFNDCLEDSDEIKNIIRMLNI